MLNRLLISALMIGGGYLMVWKADWLLRNVGAIPSAEKFIRTEGGSRLMYKLIGILAIIFGMMYFTGLLQPFGRWLVGSLFGVQLQEPI